MLSRSTRTPGEFFAHLSSSSRRKEAHFNFSFPVRASLRRLLRGIDFIGSGEKDMHAFAETGAGAADRLAGERNPGQRRPDAAVGSASFEELHAMKAREQY
jgi:hypothetical protein